MDTVSATHSPSKIIDADGHVVEPADLWETYLEPKYRSRAIRIVTDAEGYEELQIDGQRHRAFPQGTLAANLCSIGQDPETMLQPGRLSYLRDCPAGGYDPQARLQVMDEEGIDIAVLYPTIGITWEGHVTDPELAAAYCRAYNNWLHDFCHASPARLIPIAHISLLDVEAAITELHRTAKLGMRGVFLRADRVGERPHAHPDFDPFWAAAQDLDMPISLHVVTREDTLVSPWYVQRELSQTPLDNFLFFFAFFGLDVVVAFTSMMSRGLFERFPRLKMVVLETGGGWIAHWLDRLDQRFRLARTVTPLSMPPSEYFQRQCWISVEPDEHTTKAMVELVGEDRFIWASDYPHPDAEFHVVEMLQQRIQGLPATAQHKLLGANAAGLYHLA